MSATFDNNGLSTYSAMKKLVDQIEFELNNCKVSFVQNFSLNYFKSFFKINFSALHTDFMDSNCG